MRKVLLTGILALFMMGAKAQTSVNEYNWIMQNGYDCLSGRIAAPQGYQFRAALQKITSSGGLSDRWVSSYYFYRGNHPCALVLVYNNSNYGTTILCVPDKGSASQLWGQFSGQLESLGTGSGALQLIAYVLAKIASNS